MGAVLRGPVAIILGLLLVVGAIFMILQLRDKPAATTRPGPEPAANIERPSEPEQPATAETVTPVEAPAMDLTAPGAGEYSVYGVVTNAISSEPIAEASLTAFAAGPDDQAVGFKSEADGAFISPAIPIANLKVRCKADGFVTEERSVEPTAEGAIRMDFALRPAASITGRVTDAETGEPAVGGSVLYRGVSRQDNEDIFRGMRPSSVPISEEGLYQIDNVAPDSYRISVDARNAGYTFEPSDTIILDVEASKSYEDVDLRVRKSAAIQGVVVDHRGQPVSGANVMATNELVGDVIAAATLDMISPPTTVSDEQGQFKLLGIPYDKHQRVIARHNDYARGTLENTVVVERNKPSPQVRIVLTPGSAVSGMAVYEDGAPAADRDLTLIDEVMKIGDASVHMKQVKTGADGSFMFEKTPPGAYAIRAERMGPQGRKLAGVTVDGVAPVSGLRVTMTPEGPNVQAGSIDGRVVTASGAPAANVSVEARPMMAMGSQAWSATSQPDGVFSIKLEGMPGFTYKLTAKSELGIATQENVLPGDQVTLTLSAPAHVSGYVVTRSGEPVPSVSVQMTNLDKNESDQMAAYMTVMGGNRGQGVKTNASGMFDFANVTPGQYIVEAKGNEGAGSSAAITVASGVDVTGIRIELSPGTQFAGTVVTQSGQPVAGAEVRLNKASDNEFADLMAAAAPAMMQNTAGAGKTDESGHFIIHRVQPGRYNVIAERTGHARAQQTNVEVPEGGVSNFRITMGAGGTLVCRYTENGQPVEGVMIQALGAGGMAMGNTDASGAVTMNNLAAGQYMLQAMPRQMLGDMMSGGGAMPRPRTVDIRDGETTEIDLGIKTGVQVSGIISGLGAGKMTMVHLMSGGKQPVTMPTGMQDMLERVAATGGQAIASADGRFVIDDVLPGEYTLEVRSFDMSQGPASMMRQSREGGGQFEPLISTSISVGAEDIDVSLSAPAG